MKAPDAWEKGQGQKSKYLYRERPPSEATLCLILGPGLLSALALEHADGAAVLGIEHFPKERGLLAAMAAHGDRVGHVAGKNFAFKFVVHAPVPLTRDLSLK